MLSLPTQVSYPKAIDYWYSVCMLLVYGALVEYVLVNFLSTREKRLCRLLQEEMDEDTFDEGGDVLKEVIVVSETVGIASVDGSVNYHW